MLAVVPRANAASALVIAETPGAPPTSIFPLGGCAQDTVANIQQFQDLIFRPLYWYGLSGSAGFQSDLSLALAPRVNRASTVVSVTMRGWRFADGRTVDAASALFFLNLVDADPSSFCNAVADRGIPSGLRSARATGNTLTLTFSSRVNLDWLMGNDLSNVVPLDSSWDRTAAGPETTCSRGTYGAAATLAACRQVLSYLQGLGTTPSSFAGRFWQGGADGPWRVSAFSPSGDATLVANHGYSGPVKPRVGVVRLRSFSSYAGEEAALANGSVTVGTVPTSDVAPGQSNVSSLVGHDTLFPTSAWSFDGIEVNFAANDAGGALVTQTYLRAALEEAVSQRTLISSVFRGRATPGVSPLPAATPKTLATVANPYPGGADAARAALAAHGWSSATGAATCVAPGTSPSECGAGVTPGQSLTLSLDVASGDPQLDQELGLVKAAWAAIGVTLSVTYDSASDVAAACASPSATDLCWGAEGWSYLSDYYPSGDVFYAPSATASLGGYANPTLGHWLAVVETRRGQLGGYATYMAQSLPVLYLPSPETLWEYSTSLASTRPLRPCPTGALTPEYWYFT